jgi:response regulator of citrate/malate metabolism
VPKGTLNRYETGFSETAAIHSFNKKHLTDMKQVSPKQRQYSPLPKALNRHETGVSETAAIQSFNKKHLTEMKQVSPKQRQYSSLPKST